VTNFPTGSIRSPFGAAAAFRGKEPKNHDKFDWRSKSSSTFRVLSSTSPATASYLLSGRNGSGKTTCSLALTAYMRRKHSHAISDRLRSRNPRQLRQLSDHVHSRRRLSHVRYAGERWVPRPRSRSKLLEEVRISRGRLHWRNADRITPRPDGFRAAVVLWSFGRVRDAANRIFSTNKFDALKVINLTPGAGNQASYCKQRHRPAPPISPSEICP